MRLHRWICWVWGHDWIDVGGVYRICWRCELRDPADWEARRDQAFGLKPCVRWHP